MSTSSDENSVVGEKRAPALELGPRKKSRVSDPLVSTGRHFCRTVFAMCHPVALLTNGLAREVELEEKSLEDFNAKERSEHSVFRELLKMVPGLEDRIQDFDELEIVADHLRKGGASARGDDTKGLKGAILDWIAPKGDVLRPSISRNSKVNRGFHHETTGALLCPTFMDWSDPKTKSGLQTGEIAATGDSWPMFLYADSLYDENDPWKGLLCSQLLINAFKFVFTSPSSVDKDASKATRSGNARLHGMTRTTKASIAYIATQVRFALCSASVFARTDTITDSERFYHSILELLNDPEEAKEVGELLSWWDGQVFASFAKPLRPISSNSVAQKIRARRQAASAV
ncbi:hypothetical protein FIBSPDRAFT_966463 [Athelia psychrophila]|uniref:Uncharacterized protein n=1 Tax=Athelia psychrophila TaxID=1759441 RepID=A0A167WSB6_9AGAM|nr:hypothetical protein FIBSPDRAFT_966463 [Fibularhizoctonia sp. CBS 109695]